MTLLRFSTDAIPEDRRRDAVQEGYADHAKIALDFLGDGPIAVDMTLKALPGVHVAAFSTSPYSATGTTRQAAEDRDMVSIGFVTGGTLSLDQALRDGVRLPRGAAHLLLLDRPYATRAVGPVSMLSVAMPRAALAARLVDFDRFGRASIPATPELRLLASYAAALTREAASFSLEAEAVIASHIFDLANLVLGASGDDAAIAGQRGVRAARLAAIKKDVLAALADADLTLAGLAARHGITPRYVRSLFEAEGTSFTDYLLEQRLVRARRQLSDPRLAGLKIIDIAQRCGFSDLSWFNKAFRRRFGMTPGDARRGGALRAGA